MFDWTADDCVVNRVSQMRGLASVRPSGPRGRCLPHPELEAGEATERFPTGNVAGWMETRLASLGFPIPKTWIMTVLPNEGVVRRK